jgi:hypothetical protein
MSSCSVSETARSEDTWRSVCSSPGTVSSSTFAKAQGRAGMTAAEAYDLAVIMFGAEAGCWASPSGICFVGRWTPLAEVDSRRRYILRSKTKGLHIFGSGASWSSALAEAREKLCVFEAALEADRVRREERRQCATT